MKLEELYAKYDEILGALNITPLDKFTFDLTDENSQISLKGAFIGIESLLMPENGKYLVIATFVESPENLILLFPEQSNGNLGLKVFNTKTRNYVDLTGTQTITGAEQKLTLDNFKDFTNMEEITTRFNEFVFTTEGENSTNEVKNIGSFDVSHDEPVEINNTNTNNEETEMTFKPIKEEEETKWVEIPNTNAGGVRVTEDGEEAGNAEDPFADMAPDANGGGDANAAPAQDAAPAEGGDAPATDTPAPAEGGDANEAPAEPAPEAPAEGGDNGGAETPTIDDPKAKMRELLAYYTNYMNELVQDPNTSTELISATQDMIDSLIKNMESADGIEEVKADSEEAAKEEVTAEPAEGGDNAQGGDANAAPAEGGQEVAEGTGCAIVGGAAGAAVGGAAGAAVGAGIGSLVEEDDVENQADMDAKIDAEVDDLHKDDLDTDIAPITGDNILTPGDIGNMSVNDVDLTGTMPTPDEDLMATTPDMAAPAPTSDVLDDTAPMTPDEEVTILGPSDDDMIGADGLPIDKFDGEIDSLGAAPCEKKISWSPDYAMNGVATTGDNATVTSALGELTDYYKKVADEVSKVPGKEDIAMKLQKIQILSQTIANEWNNVVAGIGDTCCANSYDRSNMNDLEKDEVDSIDAMSQVGADVMADQEKEEEDELVIQDQINKFAESFAHLV